MKFAIVNFSGNVGKTTLAVNLLLARMPGAKVISVESLNVDSSSDGLEVEKMKGKKFGEMIDLVMTHDEVIVDVGASNVEDWMKLMQQYDGSHEEFDFFIVPAVKEKKQLADTVNTIRALSKLGVPRTKIRMVFNMVDTDDQIEDVFAPLFGLASAEKTFVINSGAAVEMSELYGLLKSEKITIGDVLADETDYRAKLRETTDEDEKANCLRRIAIKRLSVGAKRNLDAVFAALTAKAK
ncbi:StbB family protein [Metapseudomonas otitidis]|uniref:StbB family protein n=1 Tax=Metapseudomonas otitidis TaxID=319939 RepID=UPI000D1BA1A0|nr:StbB family protein [Pseudomonas otitidis]